MRKRDKKPKVTLASRRLLNRNIIWPQRKINRLVIKYDARMISLVKQSESTKEILKKMEEEIYRITMIPVSVFDKKNHIITVKL